jgi:hypothetical protein
MCFGWGKLGIAFLIWDPEQVILATLQPRYLDVACIFLRNSKFQIEQHIWGYNVGDLHFLSKNI